MKAKASRMPRRECISAVKIHRLLRPADGGTRRKAERREGRVSLQQNTDRIRTTHIGSLPRPHALLDIMKARLNKQPYDEAEYQARLAKAVADCVRKQADCGIDIVTDGEFSKPGFFVYIQQRLEG